MVNDREIFYLDGVKPVVIQLYDNPVKLVASNGFHHSPPLNWHFGKKNTLYLSVASRIEDDHLIAGSVLLAILYAMGLTSGLTLMKALSFLPVLGFLYVFYYKRKKFLKFTIM